MCQPVRSLPLKSALKPSGSVAPARRKTAQTTRAVRPRVWRNLAEVKSGLLSKRMLALYFTGAATRIPPDASHKEPNMTKRRAEVDPEPGGSTRTKLQAVAGSGP